MGFKGARRRAGLTVREAAKRFGVSLEAVYKWETGAYLPQGKRLPQIARVYGCTVEELLDNAEQERRG